MNKVERHMDICKHLNGVYERKNHDYGDSFHDTFVEEGMAMARIRLSDKLGRFKKLSREGSEQKVNDESIRDTLLDLANYAIMTVMEMDILEEEEEKERLKRTLNELRVVDPIQVPINEAGLVSEEERKVRERTFQFPQNCIINGDHICPVCGSKMEYHQEMDKYTCGKCGAIYTIKASNGAPEIDEDPCKGCSMTFYEKAACCGCEARLAWEKRQKEAE